MIETLFICNPANAAAKEATRRPVLPTPKAENKVLDPKKAQNIAILLRALNVTKEEVCDALCEGEQRHQFLEFSHFYSLHIYMLFVSRAAGVHQ